MNLNTTERWSDKNVIHRLNDVREGKTAGDGKVDDKMSTNENGFMRRSVDL